MKTYNPKTGWVSHGGYVEESLSWEPHSSKTPETAEVALSQVSRNLEEIEDNFRKFIKNPGDDYLEKLEEIHKMITDTMYYIGFYYMKD